LKHDYEKLVTR